MFLYVLVAFSKDKKTESKFNKVVKEEAKDYANVKGKTQYIICSTLLCTTYFKGGDSLQKHFLCRVIFYTIFSLKHI